MQKKNKDMTIETSTKTSVGVKVAVVVLLLGGGLAAAAAVFLNQNKETVSGPQVSSENDQVSGSTAKESGIEFTSTEKSLDFVPNQLLVELQSDNPEYLKRPGDNSPLGKVVAQYGQPVVTQTFKGVGESTESMNRRFQQTLERFPNRTQRALLNAQVPQLQRFYTLTFSPDKQLNVEQSLQLLKADPQLASVSPNYLVRVTAIPDDPYYSSSGTWGQSYGDLWGLEKISSNKAWEITTGDSNVVVGVVDTGLMYTHPDMTDNIYQNQLEATGSSGVDDDGNGYMDDIYGYDFAYDDSDPADDYGHGSHVSGIIAASGDNATGIAGVMWDAQILSAKALDSNGSGSTTDVAEAVEYLTDQGAVIINMSLGGSGGSTLEAAIEYAYAAGVAVVGAAGNSSQDTMTSYPAAYTEVIAVGASAQDDTLSSFSNDGPKVDVVAPGGDDANGDANNILSLYNSGATGMNDSSRIVGSEYYLARGTSMATPYVSGVVGLLLSNDPSLTIEEIRQALRRGSDDLGDQGWDIDFGYGRLNAFGSLTKHSDCEALITDPENYELEPGIETASGTKLEVSGVAGGNDFMRYEVNLFSGITPFGTPISSSNRRVTPVVNGSLAALTLADSGAYSVRLTVYDTNGRLCGEDVRVFQYSSQTEDFSFIEDSGYPNVLAFKSLATGDVNNDGKDDVLIGAPNCDNSIHCDINSALRGKVFLVYGASSGTYTLGESIFDRSVSSVSWQGNAPALLGLSVDIINLDGDDYEDVVISLPGDSNQAAQAGGICIFLGSHYASWTPNMNPASADYCFFGEVAQDYLGWNLSSGDFDGDGLDDVVTSACGNDAAGSDYGRAYILYGQDAGNWRSKNNINVAETHLYGTDSLSILCEPTAGSSIASFGKGMSVEGIGDWNADGIDDVAIGNTGSSIYLGSVHVFFGTTSGITSSSLSSANLVITEDENAYFSEFITGLGDVNGDGSADLLAGHWGDLTELVFGSRLFFGGSSVTGTISASSENTAHWDDLGSLYYGSRVFALGDINADGLNDFGIGSPVYLGDYTNGVAQIFYGTTSGFTSGPYIQQADMVLQSSSGASYFADAATAGDIDGDGDSELIVAAPGLISSGVYVFDLE